MGLERFLSSLGDCSSGSGLQDLLLSSSPHGHCIQSSHTEIRAILIHTKINIVSKIYAVLWNCDLICINISFNECSVVTSH